MRCMRCNGPLNEATFGPRGRIWSSTVVRVPVPGRTPPYALAYIDLDDGPRVLAHVVGAVDRPTVGAIVRVAGQTADGDLAVEVVR